MDKVVSEISSLQALVNMLMQNQEGYIYTHSMLTAYVAKHIIKHVSWGGDSHIERINFMVFFHDIYLVPVYEKYPKARAEEDLLFGEMLTNEEKELVLNHARLAGEQITKYKKCPSGVDTLIKQHHGMGNGVGFATDFSDNISPLSKLFMIAEDFSEYYLRQKYKNKSFKINLPEYLSELHLKYSKHTYKKIIEPLLTLKV
jgi:response regulator RpfG family c-di-GMP phosphodiesterase